MVTARQRVLGKAHGVFTIDLSKYEYVAGKVEIELDDYAIFVYSPTMIAIEKLRCNLSTNA